MDENINENDFILFTPIFEISIDPYDFFRISRVTRKIAKYWINGKKTLNNYFCFRCLRLNGFYNFTNVLEC